ncbi:metallophosphoesterase [Curtobacterium oceanosedimentum]|nr:metallophosphoesterase [Curtobacterium oceanosedimentum]
MPEDGAGRQHVVGRLRLHGDERRRWPTETGREGLDFTINDESSVAVSGDWESHGDLVFPLVRRIAREHPSVHTVLHLGDLRWVPALRVGKRRLHLYDGFIPKLDEELHRTRLRLLLTPGNHDDWSSLQPAFLAHPERPRRLTPQIWALPRGLRFHIGGRAFLSFGGAVSLDADRGTAEVPTDDDVRRAAAGGSVDVLLAHEPPNSGIAAVERALDANQRWSADRLDLSASSRSRIDRLVDQVRPRLAFHAHMHVGGRVSVGDRTTVALSVIGGHGNTVILRLASLEVDALGTAENESDS